MAKLTHLPAQPFGDGVYRFALGEQQLYELEHGTSYIRMPIGGGFVRLLRPRQAGQAKRGIYEVFASIMSGRIEADGKTIGNAFQSAASIDDICTIVRLGLVGGGRGTVDGEEVAVDEDEADRLVRAYGPPNRPLNELWEIAAALVYAVLCGVDEPVHG